MWSTKEHGNNETHYSGGYKSVIMSRPRAVQLIQLFPSPLVLELYMSNNLYIQEVLHYKGRDTTIIGILGNIKGQHHMI